MPTDTTQLLVEFRAELDKLKPAAELVHEMTAYTIFIKERSEAIQKAAVQLIESVGEKTDINLENAQRELLAFKDNSEKVIHELKTTSLENIQGLSNKMESPIEELSGLTQELKRLIDIWERADIPRRMSRMEDTLSALNTSIPNLHGRIDSLEIGLRDGQQKSSEAIGQLQNKMKSAQVPLYILLGLQLLLSIVAILLILLK